MIKFSENMYDKPYLLYIHIKKSRSHNCDFMEKVKKKSPNVKSKCRKMYDK